MSPLGVVLFDDVIILVVWDVLGALCTLSVLLIFVLVLFFRLPHDGCVIVQF